MRSGALDDSAFSAVIIADIDGKITEWNSVAVEMFGWTPSEIVGTSVIAIVPERFREAYRAGMERVRATDETFGSRAIGTALDLHALRKNGSEFPIHLSLATWSTNGKRFLSGIVREREEITPHTAETLIPESRRPRKS